MSSTVPNWAEIKEDPSVASLSPEARSDLFNKWEYDAAEELSKEKDFDRNRWEMFRVGSAVERAGLNGESFDQDEVVNSAVAGINESYNNLPYFNDNPKALFDDAEFEKTLPTIGNPIERAEARATRAIARQRREDAWTSELDSELSDLLNQASVDAKGRKVAGGNVGDGKWEDVGIANYDGREVFQITKPGEGVLVNPSAMRTPRGDYGREITDIAARIRAEGGDPEKIVNRLKQVRVWGNSKDEGNLVRKLDDGRVAVNPEAGAELFQDDRVTGEVDKLGLDDTQKETIKEQLAERRSAVASKIMGDLSLNNADWYESFTDPGMGLGVNTAELVGLKSDFNAFKAANDDKYETDEALVGAFFEKTRNRPKVVKALDSLISGIYSGRRQFALGVGETVAAIPTLLGSETASNILLDLGNAQAGLQGGLAASGGQTAAMVTRTGLDLATMVATGGSAAAATRAPGGVVNKLAGKVARRMAANASERATLGAAFETAVARNVDDIATRVGRAVGEGTAAVQSASGMFGESYSRNLKENFDAIEQTAFSTPEEKQAALEAAREDAAWTATKDGLAGGLITTALMRAIPGGFESVLGKKIAEQPGQVTLRSLFKDVSTGGLRTAFKNPEFRTALSSVARELGTEVSKEAVEEAGDEALQGLWAANRYNPDMTLADFGEQVGTAALLGGIFGGGVNAAQSALTPGQATVTPPSPVAPAVQTQAAPTASVASPAAPSAVSSGAVTTIQAPAPTSESSTAVVSPEPAVAPVPVVTPEEQLQQETEIQADVDDIVRQAEDPETPDPTPVVIADALQRKAADVAEALPETAAVIEQLAEQAAATPPPVEVVEETVVEDEPDAEPEVELKQGDTVTFGEENEETGLLEYRNVRFDGFDERGRAKIVDGSSTRTVRPGDLVFNDRVVSSPVTESPDVTPATDTPPPAELPALDTPVAEAPGDEGTPQSRVEPTPDQPDVVVSEPAAAAESRPEASTEPPVGGTPATGLVSKPKQGRQSKKAKAAQVAEAEQIAKAYPIVPTPAKATVVKGKSYFRGQKNQVSYPVTPSDAGVGVFTNDPEVTAVQLMNKAAVRVPGPLLKFLNPAIKVDSDGFVTSVTHPSEYVGEVTQQDTSDSVRDRYRTDPSVKRNARAQLDSSLSEESKEAREQVVNEAVRSNNTDEVKRNYMTQVQSRRADAIKWIAEDNFIGEAEAEDIVNKAIAEYGLRLHRAEDPSKISFTRILKSAADNWFKQKASIENAYDVDTRPTSLDELTNQSVEPGDDIADGSEDPVAGGEVEFDLEGEQVTDFAPTPEEYAYYKAIYDQAEGIIDAETMSPIEAVEALLETVDSIDDALNEGVENFTTEEQNLANFLKTYRTADPDGYVALIDNFRSFSERTLNNELLRSRSVAGAAATSPLMSNIESMASLGITVGNDLETADAASVEAAVKSLVTNMEIPKFYRNTAAFLLRSLAGRFPSLKVASTDAAFSGEYNALTNEITANMAADNGQGFIGMLLHELTHASEAQILVDPLSKLDEEMIAEMRALKEGLTEDLPGLYKKVLSYKKEMFKELRIPELGNEGLMQRIMDEAMGDLAYAIGYDYDPTTKVWTDRAVTTTDNFDLQELVAHYYTDPMFRNILNKVEVKGESQGGKLKDIMATMIAGARTAASSIRGKSIAAAAAWNLTDPRALPNANNLLGRRATTTRSYVQEWNVPLVQNVRTVEVPTSVEEISNEITRRSPELVLQSRAVVGAGANSVFHKPDPNQVGGYSPSGLLGYGAKSKEHMAALQLKRNTEAAAQTAGNRFKMQMDSFLKKNPGKEPVVNTALGNSDVKVTDAQWKASQKAYDAAKELASEQFRKDLVTVNAARRAGDPTAATAAYSLAIENTRRTLNNAYTKMVNDRAMFRAANVAQARAAQIAAVAEIAKLDPVFSAQMGRFRARLDELSAAVARSTGLSPELRAAIDANKGIYIHRAYRIFENPKYQDQLMRAYREIGSVPSPGTVNPLRAKVASALQAVRDILVKERSDWFLRESREQMIATYSQANNVSVDTARQALRNTANPTTRATADARAVDWVDNTEDGKNAVDRRFVSYAEARESWNPDMSFTPKASKDASVKADIVTRRKDLPKWLRELWGEYESPQVNAANTLMELTAYTAQEDYLRTLVAQGTDRSNGKIPFLTTAQPGTNGAVLNRIPGVDTSGWIAITQDEKSPLAGYYAHPFVAATLNGANEHVASTNQAIRLFHKLTGMAMAAKTIYSVQSHARNFFGNVFFIAANGNLLSAGVSNYGESAKDTAASLFGTSDDARADFIEKLQKLGVLKDNQVIEILNQVAGEAHKIDFAGVDKAGFLAWAVERVGAFNGRVKDIYQASDDFWKAFAFRAERAKIDAWGTNMTEDAKDLEAARRVRMTMPTYSMAPEIVKIIRRTGVVGAFITFAAETVRIAANTVKLSVEDWNAGGVRARQGAYRLGSLTFWQGVLGSVLGPAATYIFSGIASAVLGDKDDEEALADADGAVEQAITKMLIAVRRPPTGDQIRALRNFLPDWQKDAQLWVIGTQPDGDMSYMDISYINPYSYFTDIGVAAFRGVSQPGESVWEKIKDAGTNVGKRAVMPFLGEQLFSGAITDVVFGDKIWSPTNQIWNEGDATRFATMLGKGQKDQAAGNLVSSINHVWQNAFAPGTVRSAQRIYAGAQGYTSPAGRDYDTLFEVASVLGLAKIETMDPGQAVAFRMRDDLDKIRAASSFINKVAGSRGSVSDATITNAVRTSEQNQFQGYRDLRRTYDNGIALGVGPADIQAAATKLRVGKEVLDTVRSGIYLPEKPGSAVLRSIQGSVPAGEKQNRAALILKAYANEKAKPLTND